MRYFFIILVTSLCFLQKGEANSESFEPQINQEICISKKLISKKEYAMALHSLNKAQALSEQVNREIEYLQLVCYYLTQQYAKAKEVFEQSSLLYLEKSSKYYDPVLTMLLECYEKVGEKTKADHVISKLLEAHTQNPFQLMIAQAVYREDFSKLGALAYQLDEKLDLTKWVDAYRQKLKSPKKAKWYSLLLPGLGYYYAGQSQSAITSFLVNGLLIAATAQCVVTKLYPLAIALGTFECGWYFGGAFGAMRSAKQYNHILFQELEAQLKDKTQLLPDLSLEDEIQI